MTHRELSAAAGDESVVSEDGDEGQVVSLAALVVVGVVSRSDLYRPGAEVALDKVVENNRHPAVLDEWMHHELALVLLVPVGQEKMSRKLYSQSVKCEAGRNRFDAAILEGELGSQSWLVQQIWFRLVIKNVSWQARRTMQSLV